MVAFIAFGNSTRPDEELMTKRIRTTERTVPRIRTAEAVSRRLEPATVAEALGAKPCPERLEGPRGPITLYALRQEIVRRRQLSGDRPGIEGTNFRAMIPLGDRDWQRLEALATELSAEGFTSSPGQVGSILLSLALRSLNNDLATPAADDASHTAAIAEELGTRLSNEKSQ